jgi:hypothetical protein
MTLVEQLAAFVVMIMIESEDVKTASRFADGIRGDVSWPAGVNGHLATASSPQKSRKNRSHELIAG